VHFELADEPVDAVESAVRTEGNEVEGVDNGGNGRLSQEEKLGKNANGLEDLGEYPHPLGDVSDVKIMERYSRTGRKPLWLSKMSMTKGDKTKEPPRMTAPIFQAISRSRDRG
jgi:hypothetical protein